MIPLDQDKRWQRFNDPNRACPCCGRQFAGLFDVDFDHPHQWPHVSLKVSGLETLEFGDDRLTPDLCQLGDSFFIRANLGLPILGAPTVFSYTPWIGVSLENFRGYLECRQTGDFSGFPNCGGWLMNILPGWGQNSWMPATLHFTAATDRPKVDVHPHHHPISLAQRGGISFDQLLDLYTAAGHDIRPHLLAD